MTASAIYEGRVAHHRREPIDHAFSYPICMLLMDLDELALLDAHPLWSTSRPAPGRFRREDHLGDPAVPLADAVRDEVERQTGTRPDGPVRMLHTPRTFGHAFNPVRFYYCGDPADVVLAEVTNTPWGERHSYVLDPDGGQADKVFHVSPFMDMEHEYTWRLSEPGERLHVEISSDGTSTGRRAFDATLALQRRPLDRPGLTRVLTRYPASTVTTLVRIYAQALRLKLKGAPYFPHPATGAR
ncbi:MAG: DUF1365 domain-containing protein [Solirubrobacteraceae bacterium]|nr:DUF1365 domain-containing protein [Solirubrobacteraceae bacterium]